jgi:hypothetical protein
MIIFVIAYSVGSIFVKIDTNEAEIIKRHFQQELTGINQYKIFINNFRVALGMFVPGFGVALGMFSGFSTGLVYNAVSHTSPVVSHISPLRVILYDGKRMHVSDLMNILRKEGQFTDTIIDDGQIYQTMKVMAYIPSLKENVSIVINAKADTNDTHVLCTDL